MNENADVPFTEHRRFCCFPEQIRALRECFAHAACGANPRLSLRPPVSGKCFLQLPIILTQIGP
jgi:hypothetical protein